MFAVALVDDHAEFLFIAKEVDFQRIRIGFSVDKAQILRDALVEDEAADRGFYQSASFIAVEVHSDFDLCMDADHAVLICHQHFVQIRENFSVALFRVGVSFIYARVRQIIASQDHILRRRRDRGSVFRRQDVVDGKHQESGFCLCFYGQRYVYCHLVAVEVSVERGTSQRMQLDRLTFYEYRLECLDTQSVQGRCTVEHDRMFLDDAFEYIPYFRSDFFDHSLCALDVVRIALFDQFFHDERLEQFQRHLLRQTALIEFQFRSDDDYRTSGVVDTLTQQVLSETTLFALEHVGQRLERSCARACYGSAASAVVDQRVDRFLQHSLFVPDDDVRRAQFQQSVQTVVPVDDSSVQVVEVGGREAAAVELYHRTDIRRDDRDHVEHHPFRTVAGKAKCFDDFQSSDDTDLFLSGGVF